MENSALKVRKIRIDKNAASAKISIGRKQPNDYVDKRQKAIFNKSSAFILNE
mgnify:FL=1